MIHHDPLDHLTCVHSVQIRKGQPIYEPGSVYIYAINTGRVKVVIGETVTAIYGENDLINLGALAGNCSETAIALDDCKAWQWLAAHVIHKAETNPDLAIGLMQLAAQREAEASERVRVLATYSIRERLAIALLHFVAKFGLADGETRVLPPMTHELLGQYVGTSRERVTHHMNEFRRQGRIRFSRKGILLRPADLQEVLSGGLECAA